MQLGTAAILTVLVGFCAACLITNCPKGGKRAGPHIQESPSVRQVNFVLVDLMALCQLYQNFSIQPSSAVSVRLHASTFVKGTEQDCIVSNGMMFKQDS